MNEIIRARNHIRQALTGLAQLQALSNPLIREEERLNFIESNNIIQNRLSDAMVDLQSFIDRNSPDAIEQ